MSGHGATRNRCWLGVGAALLFWLVAAVPAAAHETVWDGDPNHLVQDLLVSFGLPLAILLVGALVGVGLAAWLGRGQGASNVEAGAEGPAESEAEPAWPGER